MSVNNKIKANKKEVKYLALTCKIDYLKKKNKKIVIINYS